MVAENNILPKFLHKRLQTLGYHCNKATSPAPNAYCIHIQLPQSNNILPNKNSPSYTSNKKSVSTNYATNSCNKDSDTGPTKTTTTNKSGRARNVFVKCLHSETHPIEHTHDNSIEFEADLYFANEVAFYGRIVPNFLHLEEKFQAAINVPFTSVPTCHHVEDVFIMLDDLIAAGYQSSNVNTPLKRDAAKVVVQQLGRFHAFSMALKHHQPLIFKDVVSALRRTEVGNERMFIEGVQDALKLAKMSFPKGSVYVDKLSLCTLDVYNDLKVKCNSVEDKFSVISHGDLWPNNILLKTFENAIETAVFVDFQGCKVSSFVLDLMSVLLLAIDKETRDEHRDELREWYYNSVCLKLEELGVKNIQLVFSHEEFLLELKKHSRFALAMGLVGLPLYLQDSVRNSRSSEDSESDEGELNVDPVVLYFRQLRQRKSMKCKNKMLEIIMDVVDYGYLD